jgi:competence protein ComEA
VPEPLAPSSRLNGAQPIAPEPEPEPRAAAEAAQGDPLFWERRFDDPPRPGARRRTPVASAWRERLLDRGRDLLADTRVGVVALVVVAVAAGFVWYRMGAGGEAHGTAPASVPHAVTTVPGEAPATTVAGPSATSASTGRLVVHVAGAVTKPGVVKLAAGARVIDAIEAVGGALPDGDLDRLNLAAKLSDGERVYVGRPGVADPGAAAGAIGDDGGSASEPGAKVNLNTATQAQLEGLPGVGPAFAQAILAERQRRGGFTSVNDLRSVRGIGDKRFADLAPLVTV